MCSTFVSCPVYLSLLLSIMNISYQFFYLYILFLHSYSNSFTTVSPCIHSPLYLVFPVSTFFIFSIFFHRLAVLARCPRVRHVSSNSIILFWCHRCDAMTRASNTKQILINLTQILMLSSFYHGERGKMPWVGMRFWKKKTPSKTHARVCSAIVRRECAARTYDDGQSVWCQKPLRKTPHKWVR